MNPKQIETFLAAVGRKPGPRSGKWVHTACPLAQWRHEGGTDSDPSFGVRDQPGDSRVHCFSCNYSGTAGDLVVELTRLGGEIDVNAALNVLVEAEEGVPLELKGKGYEVDVFEPSEPPHVYPEEILDAFEPAIGDGVVHPYLETRHVPYAVVEKLALLWDPYRYRIVFPVRDFEGRLRGLHGRHDPEYPYAADDVSVPYKMYPYEGETNAHVWLGEHWLDPEEIVVVAESVFDLARCLEVYDNVLSPLTAGLNVKKTKRLQGVARIVTVFDNDKAGERARKRLRMDLHGVWMKHVYLPPGKDAGDLPPGQLADLLGAYVPGVREDW